jgi:hypothetical protein
MHVERVRHAVTPRPKPVSGGYRPRALEGGVVFVCLLVLVGIVALAGLLTLFYSVVATRPASETNACAEFQGCPASEPDKGEVLRVDERLLSEPKMVP